MYIYVSLPVIFKEIDDLPVCLFKYHVSDNFFLCLESKEHSFALNFQPYDPPTKPFHASPAPIFPSTTSASSRPPSTGSATISDAHSDTGSDEPRTTKPTVEESVNLPSKESR